MTKHRDPKARGGRDERSARGAAPPRQSRRVGPEPAPLPLDPAVAGRLLGVLTVGLAALTLARAALTFVPNMWMWSLNLQRFLAPPLAWGSWVLIALSFAPALARRIEPLLARAGDAALERRPVRLMWAAAAALMVWLLPDRVEFVGDFLLRQSTLQTAGELPALWYPQAMPLDLFVHDAIGRALLARAGMTAYNVGRLLGAVEVAALALVSLAYARELRLRGSAAGAAAVIVFFGGYLTLFTGYNKCFSEMTLMVAVVGLFMVRLSRGAGSLLPLGFALAAGALIHRSTLALYPAALLALWSWSKRQPHGAWRRPSSLVAFALPVAAQAIALPHMLSAMRTVDALHFTPPEVVSRGWLAATFGPVRLADILNLVLMLSPVSLAAAWLAGAGPWRSRDDGRVLMVLCATMMVMMLLVHPQQGMYRDWDVFATVGMALSLLAAFAIGRCLGAAPARSFIAVPVVATVAIFTMQWLLHETDFDRGLARVRAFMQEPPARTRLQQATTWQFLGIRNVHAGRWEDAAAAYGEAAARLSSPNILRQLGFTNEFAGHLDRARDAYRLMLSRNPGDEFAKARLAIVTGRMDSLGADTSRSSPSWLPPP